MATSPLAPIPQPPAPKAAGEIPVDKIKVPPGFKVSLWAHGLNNARVMTWGDKGTLFVSSRTAGNVYAVVDKGGQREVKTIAKGLNLPNGVAFRDGHALHRRDPPHHQDGRDRGQARQLRPRWRSCTTSCPATCRTGGSTWPSDPTASSTSTSARPVTSASRPTPTPISRASTRTAAGFEYFAHGVRNSVGFDWHPETKDLYFATHARDWLGEDVPNDRFDVAPRRRACTSASPSAIRATFPIPSSARAVRAASSRRRWSRRAPTWPATAWSSTRARCSPPSTRTARSSPSAARGTGPRRSASA